eukprot:5330719-Pyramimonas_sp.AAC.1
MWAATGLGATRSCRAPGGPGDIGGSGRSRRRSFSCSGSGQSTEQSGVSPGGGSSHDGQLSQHSPTEPSVAVERGAGRGPSSGSGPSGAGSHDPGGDGCSTVDTHADRGGVAADLPAAHDHQG